MIQDMLMFLGQVIESTDPTMSNPCQNVGEVYECPLFTLRSYYWGDDEAIMDLPNFEYRDEDVHITATWYKHVGRGFSYSVEGKGGSKVVPRAMLKCLTYILEEE